MDISADQRSNLRILSRKIWGFFEKFVTAEDNWLPPDNYQEEPVERIAHRTSPTNTGIYLLSNLGAYDFGYITAQQLMERTSHTLQTLQKMERFNGHFFNWYNTLTLSPLFPRYVSTVDSGNMAGHLITLKQGLATIPDHKIIQPAFFEGLIDIVQILSGYKKDNTALLFFRDKIKENYDRQHQNLRETKKFIEQLEKDFLAIYPDTCLLENKAENSWRQKILQQLSAQKLLITSLAPWLNYKDIPEKFSSFIPFLTAVPSFRQIALEEQLLLQKISSCNSAENSIEENEWLSGFGVEITAASRKAKAFIHTSEQLVTSCMELSDIDYDFLYDRSQHLLTIGYNADEHRRDNSYYDLLGI